MGRPIATKIYDLYGRFYDRAEVLWRKRLAKAIAGVPFRDGDRVLDIGVGTGLSLEFYPSNVHVTGIDLSAGMLHQAQRKLQDRSIRADCRPEDTQLVQGDALNLPFADKAFDVIFLSHVVTTVPDPTRCLTEAFRVASDQATIVLVNHFRNPYPVINWVETAIDPICRKMGWRTDLSMEELLRPAGVEGLHRARDAKGFIFRIVYLQKRRGVVRLVSLPMPSQRKAELGTAGG
jgi:phosphatidylethanolamine/phosphatidyl-N-methylethanolamine N-methyltransferase